MDAPGQAKLGSAIFLFFFASGIEAFVEALLADGWCEGSKKRLPKARPIGRRPHEYFLFFNQNLISNNSK